MYIWKKTELFDTDTRRASGSMGVPCLGRAIVILLPGLGTKDIGCLALFLVNSRHKKKPQTEKQESKITS